MIRARMSRPRWSVPSGWARPWASCQPGSLRRWPISCSSGSNGESAGAKTAVKATIATTTRPNSAVRRRIRRTSSTAHSRSTHGRGAARVTDSVAADSGGLMALRALRRPWRCEVSPGRRREPSGEMARRTRRRGAPRGELEMVREIRAAAARATAREGIASSEPDPRVEIGVDHVHQKIDDHKGAGKEEHRGLHDRVVAVEDGLDGEATHAGPGEDGLGDDRAAEEQAQLDLHEGPGRDELVA